MLPQDVGPCSGEPRHSSWRACRNLSDTYRWGSIIDSSVMRQVRALRLVMFAAVSCSSKPWLCPDSRRPAASAAKRYANPHISQTKSGCWLQAGPVCGLCVFDEAGCPDGHVCGLCVLDEAGCPDPRTWLNGGRCCLGPAEGPTFSKAFVYHARSGCLSRADWTTASPSTLAPPPGSFPGHASQYLQKSTGNSKQIEEA